MANKYLFDFNLKETFLKVKSYKCKILLWEWLPASESQIYRFYDKKYLFAISFIIS